VIDPPVHDPGEECDDGPKNETISSCCTFACTFKTVGRPCDGVPNGICDGKGSCVTPGVCGNGIKEAASIIDGAPAAEECDPKEAGLSDDTGQGTCCDTHCQLHPAGFKCKFAANTCEVDSECTGTGLGLCPPQHNESHNDQLCKRNDCFINSSCLDGQCVGGTTLVCDANVTVKKPKKFVPKTNVECVPTNGATASPDARCTVQVMRPLSEGLSSTGLSLLGLGGSALTSAPIKISKKCRDASAVVAAQCPPLVDGNVVWCVNQDLALNSLDACPLNECGKALHAFAEKCPKAIDKRASGTLRENVVAKITGLSFDGEPLDEQNREKQCVGKQCP
jgi:hypothetical protein